MTTVAEALAAAAARLAAAGVDEPRREAAWLLGDLLGVDRGVLIAHGERELADDRAAAFAARVERREAREPFQHIVGEQEFHGLAFAIDGRALVPRPETELLVDTVLAADLPQGAAVADLGTGSGCIAVALAVARPDLRLLAIDRSEHALALARKNIERHEVADRVTLARADLSIGADRAALPAGWRGELTAVVSNPPYVSAAEWKTLEPEVRDHDPRRALVPGPSGLEAYPIIVALAAEWLVPGGFLAVEVGAGQAAAVERLATRAGFTNLRIHQDLRSIDRVVAARLPHNGGS